MRLIDADALARDILNEHCFPVLNSNYSERDLERSNNLSKIFNAPTIDAEPVRHGHWEHLGGDEWCCSNCGEVIFTEGSWEAPTSKYCQNCGAKMDEVSE